MSAKHGRMSHNRDYVPGAVPVSSFRDSVHSFLVYLVCLVDKRSRIYPHPVAFSSLDIAKRDLLCKAKYDRSGGHPPLFVEWPDDFVLVLVGRFDVLSGVVHPCNEVVAEVSDILAGGSYA